MLYQILFSLYSIMTDVINTRNCKRINRNHQSLANESDKFVSLLDFDVLELGVYLERETSPALVLANGCDNVCHPTISKDDQRENLIVCEYDLLKVTVKTFLTMSVPSLLVSVTSPVCL